MLLKTKVWYKCFPVNFPNIFWNTIIIEHLGAASLEDFIEFSGEKAKIL